MKQEENLKNALLQGAHKFYNKATDITPLLSQQLVSFLGKYESLFKLQHLKLLNRVKLYELLEIMILLDNEVIS